MIAERINVREYNLTGLLDRIEGGLEFVFEDCFEYMFDRFPLRDLENLWKKIDESVLCPIERYLQFRY